MAIKAEAIQADEYAAFKRIAVVLRKEDPNIAAALGF